MCVTLVSQFSLACLAIFAVQQWISFLGSGCVAQLVQWSLPITEVCGLKPVIGKNLFILNFYCQLCIEKMKIKKKRLGMAHFFKKTQLISLSECLSMYFSCNDPYIYLINSAMWIEAEGNANEN